MSRFTGTPEQRADLRRCQGCGRPVRPDIANRPRLASDLVAAYCGACSVNRQPHDEALVDATIIAITGDKATVETIDSDGLAWRRVCSVTRFDGVSWLHRPFSDWAPLEIER